jgi:hypothetical protein
MDIVAHEDTDIDEGVSLGNSCEGQARMFSQGIGISAYVRFTKDKRVVLARDMDLSVISHGASTARISDIDFDEATNTAWQGNHLASLSETLISIPRSIWFNNRRKRDISLNINIILHIDNNIKENNELDVILEKVLRMCPVNTIICTHEKVARYLRDKSKTINLCCPPSLLTTSTAEEIDKLRRIYNWVWVEDSAARKTIVELKKNGFRTILVSTKDVSETALERLIDTSPDILCTTQPQLARELSARRIKTKRSSLSALRILHPRTIKQKIIDLRYKAFLSILSMIEKKTGKFITFHTRPIYAKDVTHLADTLVDTPSIAIILQGPILKKYDFTLETIRIYKKVYKGLVIIISTWEDEDALYLAKIRDEGVEIVLNKKPSLAGPLNVNMQIISAHNGVKRAKELGVQYVIKSRTDQRMYNKNILETLHNLIQYFPPSDRSGQKKRMLFISNMRKYQPYYLSDTFMFGDTDDVLQYWSTDLVGKDAEYAFFVPEVYFATEFFKSRGWPITWSIKATWEIYRECIITIDWSEVDLFWFKYNYFWEHRDYRYTQQHVPSTDYLRFHEWFNIFNNMENKTVRQGQEEFFRLLPPKKPLP